ncbi:Cytochrome b5 heme-binding domain-containing protein [Mycena chlorophos]|uniref:Cytochrome b5 heme-binding domain-containing protein n=1 Tax=Mycena chlorophos TaxID=658473 RepID=A0A8H6TDM2_MYCCL|nr:Cytochrome b5 heme-binding domain-containing protein [Mycena chlorophos]
MALKTFSRDQVAKVCCPSLSRIRVENGHSTIRTETWHLVIIDSKVYDLSKFAKVHPGGISVLLDSEIAGQDATERFYELHRTEVIEKYTRLQVGVIEGEEVAPSRVPGAISSVPYAEPTWLAPGGYHSPYYKEHHRRFQKVYRRFVEDVVVPDAQARESDGQAPSKHVVEEMCRLNILAMQIGPGKHLNGRVLMDGLISHEEVGGCRDSTVKRTDVTYTQFDPFIELIITQSAAKLHARGYNDGLGGGTIIGLPPVINFAQPALRDRVVEDALSGKRPVCLAVTEPFAGSDVAGIRTRARKTEDGYWIVNGSKKWITTGTRAHWFTTACRTDDGEIVVLLIERDEGVETKPIKTLYSATAGTAFITFDNVRVPDSHRLGPGTPGLLIILTNFSHERYVDALPRNTLLRLPSWVLVAHNIARQRVIYEECMKWANQRKVFGKPLSSQAVVRQKLAAMIARFESCQSWLEAITFQMCRMSPEEQAKHLAGPIALLKMHATRESQKTAADAIQIFGGRGITKTGMGRFVEHFHHSLLIDS